MMEWIRFGLVAALIAGALVMVFLAITGVFRFQFVLNRMHMASLIDTGAMLLLTCLHRTLGAWQFGARYTCDMIPFVYMYLAGRGEKSPANWELWLGGLAVAFNAYGAIYMYMYG